MPPQKDRFVNFVVGPAKGSQNHHAGEDGEVCMAGVRMYTEKSSCSPLTRAKAVAAVAVSLVLILTACLLVSLIAKLNNQCAPPPAFEDGRYGATSGPVSPPLDNYTLDSSDGNGGETTSPTSGSSQHWQTLRLPTSLEPLHYELRLRADISRDTFAGAVTIHFACRRPTRFIQLHSLALNITSVELSDVSETPSGGDRRGTGPSTPSMVGEPEFYREYSFMTLRLDGPLSTDHTYTLRILYNARFSADNNGLYVSTYRTNKGESKYVIASFLSPNGARKVFPCFDEPSFKANFTATVIHEDAYVALSNMPEAQVGGREALGGGLVATRFETTPKMSTYLVAFVVCDFWYETRMVNDIQFRIWARADIFNDTVFALQYGSRAFNFLQDYSGFDYPLPKIDLIALPETIVLGMENWGLLIFREESLLVNQLEAPSKTIQSVATVIAHELAHQWYSNLVTQEYWDELWLKECFATLLAHLTLDHIYPDWKMLDELSLAGEEFLRLMVLDALPTSHAVQAHITDISDILNNFDITSYYKSEAVLRMLRYILGPDAFQSGLTRFLQSRAYSNAKATDLWDALSEDIHQQGTELNITDFMNPWVLQMGYPVITLTRDYQARTVEISQEPFLLHPNATKRLPPSPYNYQWKVPIFYSYEHQPSEPAMEILREPSDVLSLDHISSDQWIVANSKRTGLYRTNYDVTNWNMLIHQLQENHEAISPTDRAMLIDDAFHLATAGRLSIAVALNLTKYLHKEREYVPWKVTLHILGGYVNRMLTFTSAYGNLKKYLERQLLPVYDEIGWNSTRSHKERLLQIEILKTLCSIGNKDCATMANTLFLKHVQDGIEVPANFKTFVYMMGVAQGDYETREVAWNKYRYGATGEAQQWLGALAATKEPWVLSRYLERSLDTSLVSSQDTLGVFKFASGNPIGGILAWNFFRQHWNILKERYASGVFQMNQIIDTVTQWFNTDFQLKELQDFAASKEQELAGKAGMSNFRQAEETTKVNILWMKNNYRHLEAWLEAEVASG